MKTATCLLIAMISTAPAWAKHWHEDKKHWQRHEDRDYDDAKFDHRSGACYFEPHDVRVIHEYYAPRYRPLPPGLAMKLHRTGHLPPGWERRMEPIPVVVERQLPPLAPTYRRGFIDGYAVVYNPGTQVIIDVTAVF